MASRSPKAASTSSGGIRAPSITTPLALRIASANSVAQVSSHTSRAAGNGLEGLGGVLDVVLVEQPADLSLEGGVGSQLLELVEFERFDRAVGVLHDEDEVDDADRLAVDELGQGGYDLAREVVAPEKRR